MGLYHFCPTLVPVFRRHNKLSEVKWVRNADWWPRVPMFSKREGILVSKLGAETHGPGRGRTLNMALR